MSAFGVAADPPRKGGLFGTPFAPQASNNKAAPSLFGNTPQPTSVTPLFGAGNPFGQIKPGTSGLAFRPSSSSAFNATNTDQSQRESIVRNANEAPDYGNDFITIIVGPSDNETRFVIHEGLAKSNSAFIDTASKNGERDKEERIVRLPDHDAEHFRIFHNFVYHRYIYSRQPGDDNQDSPEGDKEWVRLAKSYVLGAHFQFPDFLDAVTDAIIEKALKYNPITDHAAQESMHEFIYQHTSSGAGICRLLVDIAATRWNLSTFQAHKPSPSSAEFFFELSVTLHKLKTGGLAMVPLDRVDEKGATCAYHDSKSKDGLSAGAHVCWRYKSKA